MKKLISILLSLIIVTTTEVMPAVAKDSIKVTLNGQEIKFDVQPQIINERTMVPVRAIFEALGASVEWDQTTQTVTSKKDNTIISLAIDNPVMMVNDKQVTLDQPACIIDERTLVPVRAISEAYGTTVEWDQATKTVSIITADYVAPPVVQYDDISANINQIKDMIKRGLYLEAVQECKNARNWHNLSPADTRTINTLQADAQNRYNNYLDDQKQANKNKKVTDAQKRQMFEIIKTNVSRRLKSPSTAIWPNYNDVIYFYTEKGTIWASGKLEAMNGFGGYGKVSFIFEFRENMSIVSQLVTD